MNPIPGIIFFVLTLQSPHQHPMYEFIEVPTADECALLVKEAVMMNNEILSGMKITGACVTVVPQTWAIKDQKEDD